MVELCKSGQSTVQIGQRFQVAVSAISHGRGRPLAGEGAEADPETRRWSFGAAVTTPIFHRRLHAQGCGVS
jgi:hypothetical protein